MTTLTPEQIEAVRIMDGQTFQPGILNALCDLALAGLTALPREVMRVTANGRIFMDGKDVTELVEKVVREQQSSPPQTRAERIKQLETERDAYLAEDAAGGDFCPHEYLITNAAGSRCVKCGSEVTRAGGETYTPDESSPPQTRHLPCGCILCICEDEKRCHGCGAKMCGQHSSPPQDARVRSAEATKLAAGGDSMKGGDVNNGRLRQFTDSQATADVAQGAAHPDNTPTPLVDAAEFDAEIWEDLRTSDRIVVDSVVKADFARSLERVARMMAEDLIDFLESEHLDIDPDFKGIEIIERAKKTLAAWRELEERK